MGFESILDSEIKKDLNKNEYRQAYKERPHISKSKLDEFSDTLYLKVDEIRGLHYTDELSPRYIAIEKLTYDAILSLYDVNEKRLTVYRFYLDPWKMDTELKKYLFLLKKSKPNLEARIIGLQNNQDYYLLLGEISGFLAANNVKLVEIDLFGADTRNIALDTKLGMSFNILLEDRPYRPGELANTMTVENFEATLSK